MSTGWVDIHFVSTGDHPINTRCLPHLFRPLGASNRLQRVETWDGIKRLVDSQDCQGKDKMKLVHATGNHEIYKALKNPRATRWPDLPSDECNIPLIEWIPASGPVRIFKDYLAAKNYVLKHKVIILKGRHGMYWVRDPDTPELLHHETIEEMLNLRIVTRWEKVKITDEPMDLHDSEGTLLSRCRIITDIENGVRASLSPSPSSPLHHTFRCVERAEVVASANSTASYLQWPEEVPGSN